MTPKLLLRLVPAPVALAAVLAACSPASSEGSAMPDSPKPAPETVSALAMKSPGVGVCARVDQSLIPQHKAELEALIERQVGSDGGKVTVERRMEVGDWLAVWATPANLERGVFFIRNTPQGPTFLETWGGVAGPEDRADVQAWARALDPEMPVALADCFAKELSEEG